MEQPPRFAPGSPLRHPRPAERPGAARARRGVPGRAAVGPAARAEAAARTGRARTARDDGRRRSPAVRAAGAETRASRAMHVASRSGEIAGGPNSESCAERGRSGCAMNRNPETGAPGRRASRSRRTSVRSVFTSRVGAGRSTVRLSAPPGSRVRASVSRAQASACEARRMVSRSSAVRATKRNGSTATIGHSSSIPSEKRGGTTRGTSGRGSIPRATWCRSRPASPKRATTSPSDSRASSPIRERPQRSRACAI